MAKLSIKPGSTSVVLDVFIQNSSVTTGAGLTGLAYNSAGLTAYYVRPAAAAAAITLATQTTTGAYSSGGFVEIDSTNMPGWYRFDVPDAVLATGVRHAGVCLKGATNMAPCNLEIDLNAEVNTTHLNGTAQTARDIGASVLLSSGTGTGQVSLTSGTVTIGTNNDKTGYALSAAGVDAIYDEAISGHLTAGTTGLYLAIAGGVILDTTVTGTPTSTQMQFSGGSTTANFYQDKFAYVISGTAIAQGVPILTSSYSGGTTTLTFDEAWKIAAVAGDRLVITIHHIHPVTQISSQVMADLDANGSAVIDAILADTADMQPKLGTPAGASMSADIAAVKSDTAATLTDTGTTIPAQISALNNVSVSQILTTQMTESYAADGAAPTLAQSLMLIQQMLGDFTISGTTLTVRKVDGSTTAATFTLNDSTSPTAITRTT